MNPAEILAARLVAETNSQWSSLVELALLTPAESVDSLATALSGKVKVGADSIKRKIQAIKHLRTTGFDGEAIKALGQEEVLGRFGKSKRQQSYGETVTMKWSVPGSQRELVQQQEKRVKRLTGIVTSEDFWDWWLAQVTNASNQEIIDSKGEDVKAKAPRAEISET